MGNRDGGRGEGDDALYRLVVENADDYAIFVVDTSRRVVTWNRGAERLLGYGAAEMIGRPADVIFTPEDLEAGAPEREAEEAMRSGRAGDDRWHLRKDGTRFWASGVVTRLDDGAGGVRGLAKILRDQTALKLAEGERDETEKALRASEARVRRLIEANIIGVGISSAAGTWVDANDALLRLLGCSRDDLRAGRVRWDRMTPDEYREADARGIADADARGACEPYEKEYVRADGRRVPVLIGYAPVTGFAGHYVCFVLDLTPLKQAESGLRASEERFRSLFESMDEGYCVVEPVFDASGRPVDYRYLLANPALEHHTGLRDIVGKTAREVMPGHEYHWIEAYARVAATGEPFRRTDRVADLGRWFEVSAFPVGGGQVGVLFADVTARHVAEEGLKASEARLADIFRHAPSFMCVLSGPDHVFERVNDEYSKLIGGRAVVGMPIREALPEVAGQGYFETLGRVYGTGEPYIGTDQSVDIERGGRLEERIVDFVYQPIRDAGGAVTGVLVQGIDITDRKRAELEVRRSEAKLRLLAVVDAETRALNDPAAITAVTARLLAEHLDADRCAYAEVEGGSVFVITGDHNRGVPSIVGRWPVASFGAECTRQMVANEPYVVADTDTDPRIGREDLAAYRATDIRAVICVPLHKEGAFSAAMAVHQKTPRRWSEEEVELVRLVVSRCWESLERARVTRSLRESEERFRLFMDYSPASAWITDTEGRIDYLSPSYYRMFRLPGDDVVGRSVLELYPRELADQYVGNIRSVAESGRAIETIEDGVLADGRPGKFLVFKFPLPVKDGRQLVGGVAVDITGRVDAERRLSESEERYRTLAENVEQLFWTSFPDGRCDYLSSQWVRYTGIPEEEQLGFEWIALVIHPDDRDRTLKVWMEAVSDRATYDVNYRIRGANGEYRWFKVRGTPIRDDSGAIVKWFGTCTDIDAQVRAEVALREADRKKDEFLAMLAHELRNPLAAIGNAVQLSGRSQAQEHQEWSREVIGKHVGSLSRMIDDLLDVSRITRGKIELRKEPLDVLPVLSHAAETVRPLIQEKKHELTVSHSSSSPMWVEGDPHRLEQVIVNLLNNAAKYTDPGGTITLSARPEGDSIAITVADNGGGIPPEKIPEMFELFSQGDRSIARSEGGLGIGLTLVKSLVEMHGGSVVAKSEGLGKGSQFTVRLPAVTAPTQQRNVAAASHAEAPRSRARVLVVDDNHDSAVGLSRLLRVLGNDVEVAHDGPSALRAAHRFRPDYVLLDIGLPGMDGYEVAEKLRGEGFLEAVIIAVSGYGEEAARRRSREAGFDHHLVKPVDYDELVAIIRREQ